MLIYDHYITLLPWPIIIIPQFQFRKLPSAVRKLPVAVAGVQVKCGRKMPFGSQTKIKNSACSL